MKTEKSSPSGCDGPKVRVGFIGAGSVLWAYLAVLDKLVVRGHSIEGPVCARRRETWPSLLARRPGIKLVSEPKAVVESDVDVVVVITPADSHQEFARLALEHGKHILVEKPFALSARSGKELGDFAASRGLMILAAPFVQLSPTFRALSSFIDSGTIGRVHSARGLYGNGGSRVLWHHQGGQGPISEKGIYNLKSVATLLGPISEVLCAEATAIIPRQVGLTVIQEPDSDVAHMIVRHESGALSSLVSSNAIQRYRRPGLELYGVKGTANLLGDDWDPRGLEIWRNEAGRWEEYEPIEATWHWADGLRELVLALRESRMPMADIAQDIHLLEVIEAAHAAAWQGTTVSVRSRFCPLNLAQPGSKAHARHSVHDHTRPEDEQ